MTLHIYLFFRLNYIKLLIFNHFLTYKNDNTYLCHNSFWNTSQNPVENTLRQTVCSPGIAFEALYFLTPLLLVRTLQWGLVNRATKRWTEVCPLVAETVKTARAFFQVLVSCYNDQGDCMFQTVQLHMVKLFSLGCWYNKPLTWISLGSHQKENTISCKV